MIRSVVGSWLVAIGVLTVAVAIIGLAGGFQPVAGHANAELGKWIRLTRWDVAVDGCHVEPGGLHGAGTLVLSLRVVNRWTDSQNALNREAYRIDLPTGEAFGGGAEPLWFEDAERLTWFDPDIERPANMTMQLTQPLPPGSSARVRFASEREGTGYILADKWEFDQEQAELSVPCEVPA